MPKIISKKLVKPKTFDKIEAGNLFDKIEGFAGYGFNKSHSIEYSLISYQCMWLKTYYTVEFVASALTGMDEDKIPALLKDADRLGIEVCLPDINISSGEFEILNDAKLAIPFTRVKGISHNTANAIIEARKDGPFKSKEDLEKRVERRKCNIGHIDKLDRIGAFASIEPTQLPAKSRDRIKDQVELLPGLVTDIVPIEREMNVDKFTKAHVAKLILEYRDKHGPSSGDGVPVKPAFGKNAKFMAIFDAPTSSEESIGMISYGNNFTSVSHALADADLSRADGYWTSLIKRPKEGKQVSPDEIKTFVPYLTKEIELLKPPLIVLMGTQSVRHFFPDFKGKASEAGGKVIYDKATNTNFIIGFNPGEIYHDPDKQQLLNDIMNTVSTIIS
jgi:DNA polymerase-3 subunit alpha